MNFKDVVGQEFIIKYIKNVWDVGRMPHALLFSGQDGVGKTAVAGILAMLKFCQNPDRETSEPCGTCMDCLEILDGSHPDMCQLLNDETVNSIKIGDAEDIPPSDPYRLNYPVSIREVLYSLERKASRGRGKFFFLQHSEKLTTAGANALLKAIEEPSRNTLCVLTTVNAESNLPTIVSRCHVLRFRNIPAGIISEYLQTHMNIDREISNRIAAMSRGSLARAAEITGKRILNIREWLSSVMAHIEEWDTFVLSEEMRELAPGLVLGFDEDGNPEGKALTKTPLREGLQQILEMMLEYLRDVSVADDNPPFCYFEGSKNSSDHESIAAAQEDIIQAYSAIGQNVNPVMVIDNMLSSVKSRFINSNKKKVNS